jgi:transcriptional regulator with XRE-family HTH domain
MSLVVFCAKWFGEKIREEREDRRCTQEALAARARMSRPFLGRIERGKQVPSVEVAMRLAWALGVPVQRLFEPPEKAREAQLKHAAEKRREIEDVAKLPTKGDVA